MHQTRVTGLSHLTFAALSLLMATAISGCKAESNTFSAANASVGSGTGSVDANAGFGIKISSFRFDYSHVRYHNSSNVNMFGLTLDLIEVGGNRR